MNELMPRGPRSSRPNWAGPKPQPTMSPFQHPYGFQQPPGLQQPPGYPAPYAFSQDPPRIRDGARERPSLLNRLMRVARSMFDGKATGR